MPVDIRLVTLREFVRTDLVGAFDLEASKAALTEIVRAAAQCGVPNLLIDVRMAVPVELCAADVQELVMHLLLLGVDPGYRIAILSDPQDEVDRAKVFESYARERGVDAAAFRDFETALTWLCKLPSQAHRGLTSN